MTCDDACPIPSPQPTAILTLRTSGHAVVDQVPTLVLPSRGPDRAESLSLEMAGGIPGEIDCHPRLRSPTPRNSRGDRRGLVEWLGAIVSRVNGLDQASSDFPARGHHDAARRHNNASRGEAAKETQLHLRIVNSAIKKPSHRARWRSQPPRQTRPARLFQKCQHAGTVELYDKGGRAELANQSARIIAIITAYLRSRFVLRRQGCDRGRGTGRAAGMKAMAR